MDLGKYIIDSDSSIAIVSGKIYKLYFTTSSEHIFLLQNIVNKFSSYWLYDNWISKLNCRSLILL